MLKSKSLILTSLFLPWSLANAQVNVSFNFNGGTQLEQAIFEQAASFWESNLTGYSDGINRTVNIDTTIAEGDGVGGVLGSAGPNFITSTNDGFTITFSGVVNFDSFDVGNLVSQGTFLDVAIHEIGHVLGFGTLWDLNNVYDADPVTGTPGQYTAAEGLAAYQAEFDPTAAFIPIELDGGEGTANGHFNETSNVASDTDPGDNLPAPTVLSGPNTGRSLNDEILTGFLSNDNFISETTLGTFRDIGFTTASSAIPIPDQITSIPEPSSLVFTFSGIAWLTFRRRR